MVIIRFIVICRVARNFSVWRTHSHTLIILLNAPTQAPQFSGVGFGTNSLISNSTSKWNLSANAQFLLFVEFEIFALFSKGTPEQ